MKSYSQFVRTTEDGRSEIDTSVFLNFYSQNVQKYEDLIMEDGTVHRSYEGLSLDNFIDGYARDNSIESEINFMKYIIDDEKLSELQSELETEDKQICMINISYLCKFLCEKAKSRNLVLLKPQIEDTLSELKRVKKVVFINEDGSKVESTSGKLISVVVAALEAQKDNRSFEVEKWITWDSLADNKVMQSCFVYDLASFLHFYFPVKRKKDALVSTKEQELIRYLMFKFGLTSAVVTDSRYRQLLMYYKTLLPSKNYCTIKDKDGCGHMYKLDFIQYSKWKTGKMDWTIDNTFEIKLDDVFQS